ncbi:MAG TPA: cyclic nucleotide-binding domain-containing protein, partial [Accumulibacter sp.]|nr:cyclic nucleotide-binding domain-containing protein [Accumulibacter sp.]
IFKGSVTLEGGPLNVVWWSGYRGQAGDSFYFLVAGELKVLKNGLMLDILTPGECFGEMAVIGKSSPKRGADIVTLTDSRLLKIPATDFKTTSEACRMHFYQAFLSVLSERLSMVNNRLVTV